MGSPTRKLHGIGLEMKGLTQIEVLASRKAHGENIIPLKQENGIVHVLKGLARDPMIVLLLASSTLYFVSGHIGDGIFMMVAILVLSLVSIFQNKKSEKALAELKVFSLPSCQVIREHKRKEINQKDLVMGDYVLIEEGARIPADGTLLYAHDFSVDESTLTGESLPIYKDLEQENRSLFQGTTVSSGLAIAEVSAIGPNTRLGKIGQSIDSIEEEKTPLEEQIGKFVGKMVVLGAIIFLIVWGVNYVYSRDILDSLLHAVTLAMSILPEEIPVAFSIFMALGAMRMMKKGILVKQMKTVETLGSATVICVDKTGTITENKMSLASVYVFQTNQIISTQKINQAEEKAVVEAGMWASEPVPFDPMEIALHQWYSDISAVDQRSDFKLVHDYPLEGHPPMMTHVFENDSKQRIIAAKGALEAIMTSCDWPNPEDLAKVKTAEATLSSQGFRLLGVGTTDFQDDPLPQTQQELRFKFKGILAFYDPPKKNMPSVLKHFYTAGIQVKIITGDNAQTTQAIGKQIGFKGYDLGISGEDLMKLSEDKLSKAVDHYQVFTRMFPDAKLRIIEALKKNKEIVAMTGDGINDGPALKSAHIGIAMGKKGTEIAKQSASLILLKDDLIGMVHAVGIGRVIYANLKKAIQFIISIHIPIILTVFIPLVLGWKFPNIFSPIHIIFLELIMGPTCSVVYENEPMEANVMSQPPRPLASTFFSRSEISISVVQGLVITLGTLSMYQYALYEDLPESVVRTFVFTTLMASNISLTLVNRSFVYSLWTTLGYKNDLILWVIGTTMGLLALILYVDPITRLFSLQQISPLHLGACLLVGCISVLWIELVKGWRRLQNNHEAR